MTDKVRAFECARCSYRFLKQHAAVVEKCGQCSYPVFDHDVENPFPGVHISEKEMVRRLDPYARMKYEWYKYPKYHSYMIQHRKVINGKTYMMDAKNTREGVLPEVIV
jgi:ribosomal protein S27AE